MIALLATFILGLTLGTAAGAYAMLAVALTARRREPQS